VGKTRVQAIGRQLADGLGRSIIGLPNHREVTISQFVTIDELAGPTDTSASQHRRWHWETQFSGA
jgi:hypothetical protein